MISMDISNWNADDKIEVYRILTHLHNYSPRCVLFHG